jgi:hypothetical protein
MQMVCVAPGKSHKRSAEPNPPHIACTSKDTATKARQRTNHKLAADRIFTTTERDRMFELGYLAVHARSSDNPATVTIRILKSVTCRVEEQFVTHFERPRS